MGCIPSKTLLKAARVVHEMRTADRFGLDPLQANVPFARVMQNVRTLRERVYHDADAPPNLEKLGVEAIFASARFCDPHTVELCGASNPARRITAHYFVIATGSRPVLPVFSAPYLTNESIFELTSQPERLLIMGAGPVGIEMAQAFQRLGTAVTIVAAGNKILPRDEPEHAKSLCEILSREGVTFILGHTVTALEKSNGGLQATVNNGAHLGASEADVIRSGRLHAIYRFSFDKLDRAITEHATDGEIKIIAAKSGRILGVSILGENAGEMISEYALAMRNGLRLSQISETIHPYPTYLLGNRRAAGQPGWKQLDSPLLGLWGKLSRFRGVRKGSSALS